MSKSTVGKCWDRLIINLMSTKLWAYFLVFIVSMNMVYDGKMTGDVWASLIISVFGMAFGMREISKSRVASTNKDEFI